MNRRTFVSFFSGVVGLLAGSALAQDKPTAMEKGQAVVCETGKTKCPLGHETCYEINAPLVVGSGSYQNPDVGQVFTKVELECQVCHVLFIKQ
jgi:hypothetical protein